MNKLKRQIEDLVNTIEGLTTDEMFKLTSYGYNAKLRDRLCNWLESLKGAAEGREVHHNQGGPKRSHQKKAPTGGKKYRCLGEDCDRVFVTTTTRRLCDRCTENIKKHGNAIESMPLRVYE